MARLMMDELRALSVAEVEAKIDEKRLELYKLRMAWAGNQLENPNQVREARRDLARLLTILRERELAAEIVKGEK
jgi:large subunit ribosomal protein L29